MEPNSYKSPPDLGSHDHRMAPANAIGRVVAVIGVVFLVYGSLGFWVVPWLPPNGGINGRLPSIYLMGTGIVVTLTGLAIYGWSPQGKADSQRAQKGIPSSIGILVLIAILVAFFVLVSRL